MVVTWHPELSGCITTLTVANFCAAMDTLIDQNGYLVDSSFFAQCSVSYVLPCIKCYKTNSSASPRFQVCTKTIEYLSAQYKHIIITSFPLVVEKPCHKNNGGCSHGCHETINNGFYCSCPQGISLADDGKTCHSKYKCCKFYCSKV